MPPHERAAASAIAAQLDPGRIERILAPWLPDAQERAFVVRCIIDEGPIHHRGASYALLALAGQLAERLGALPPTPGEGQPVAMRLPPHLRPQGEAPAYPLRLDPAACTLASDGSAARAAALADAASDGPPHHALANVALLNLLAAMLRSVGSRA